jgi:hypothetical protein
MRVGVAQASRVSILMNGHVIFLGRRRYSIESLKLRLRRRICNLLSLLEIILGRSKMLRAAIVDRLARRLKL